jgi:predicted nucleic acid-binding protein
MEDMMNQRIPRIYVDSSVVSGMFDTNDHPEKTAPFWNTVEKGKIKIVISDVLEQEIADAPIHVRDFFASLPEYQIERVVSTDESDSLAEQYITAGIATQTRLNDCKHVAIASIHNVDVLVSWNFKHIVNLNRIHRYNAISKLHGFAEIEIRTPYEVIHDET